MLKIALALITLAICAPSFAQMPQILISIESTENVTPKRMYLDLHAEEEQQPAYLLKRARKTLGFDLSPGVQLIEVPSGQHRIRSITFDDGDSTRSEHIVLNYISWFKKDKVVFLGHFLVGGDRVMVDNSDEKLKVILSSIDNIDMSQISKTTSEMQSQFYVQAGR